jgi:hypothetical protein
MGGDSLHAKPNPKKLINRNTMVLPEGEDAVIVEEEYKYYSHLFIGLSLTIE